MQVRTLEGLRVREAASADAEQISSLLGELGYPSPAPSVSVRLNLLARENRAVALVAERRGVVLGLVTAHAFASVHADDPVGWVTTLVVASEARRQSIGRLLLEAVERWASGQGCTRVSVLSARHRSDAHAFYGSLGYADSGRRYTKSLRPGNQRPPAV